MTWSGSQRLALRAQPGKRQCWSRFWMNRRIAFSGRYCSMLVPIHDPGAFIEQDPGDPGGRVIAMHPVSQVVDRGPARRSVRRRQRRHPGRQTRQMTGISMHKPVQALLSSLNPHRFRVDPGQHPTDPLGHRTRSLTHYSREDQRLHHRTRLTTGLAQLGGDDGGPPRVQVTGAHRRQRQRQPRRQRGSHLDLATGRDRTHRQHRPETVRRELTDMTNPAIQVTGPWR